MQKIVSTFILITIYVTSYSQGGGPWEHKVFRAYSADGTNFIRDADYLFYPASVPDAITDTNQIVHIYYVKMDSAGDTEKLLTATSDDGIFFNTPQAVVISGSTVVRRVDPCAQLLEDGRIRLYYIDIDMVPPQHVHSAISDDGIAFTEEPGIRFSDPSGITDPDVFSANGVWNMYLSKGTNLVRAVSNDGLTFLPDTNFVWSGGAVSSTIQLSCGFYRTFYCGIGIQSASTSTGAALIPENITCLAPEAGEIICDPTIIRMISGEFVMYFKSAAITTSISDNNSCSCKSGLWNYPNPFHDKTIIQVPQAFGNDGVISFELFDSKGISVMHEQYLPTEMITIERGNLLPGIYFYSLQNEKKIVTDKFIIE